MKPRILYDASCPPSDAMLHLYKQMPDDFTQNSKPFSTDTLHAEVEEFIANAGERLHDSWIQAPIVAELLKRNEQL